MDKSPDAFRTISEVAEFLGTPAHVLRFWESRFPQIKPVKRAGGRRYYRPTDVALLAGIKRLLHDDGLTIRGVQKILRDHGVRQVAGLTGDGVSPGDLSFAPALVAVPTEAAPTEADVEAGFIHVDDPLPDPVPAAAQTRPPAQPAAPPVQIQPAQSGLPLFDAPPAFGASAVSAPVARRRPTLREDATFSSLIRGLPRGALQARQPELVRIALRLRALRARLVSRAEGGSG